MSVPAFRGQDLSLEMLDPVSTPLVRLFRHAGGDWAEPPEIYRNLRVDPPAGHKASFAVLYTANTLPTVAIECGVLRADALDQYSVAQDLAQQYQVVRYAFGAPALFVPIDGPNREVLGLAGPQRKFLGYEPYQAVAFELFRRYAGVVHGLSWESFHRNQQGRVYALWHQHKSTIDLTITTPAPYRDLAHDDEWLQFLQDNPEIEVLVPPPA